MGELKKAIEYMQKAIPILKKVYGNNHHFLAISYANISQFYLKIKNLKEAKKNIDKAVDILQYNFPNGHPSLDISLNTQKNIYSKL